MRIRLFLSWLLLALAAGCASKPAPDPSSQSRPNVAQAHEECAGRMYASRSRGAVHWHIYENCLKEHQ